VTSPPLEPELERFFVRHASPSVRARVGVRDPQQYTCRAARSSPSLLPAFHGARTHTENLSEGAALEAEFFTYFAHIGNFVHGDSSGLGFSLEDLFRFGAALLKVGIELGLCVRFFFIVSLSGIPAAFACFRASNTT
jgi:hypothetical protein